MAVSEEQSRPLKRRRTDMPRQHSLRHVQRSPEHVEMAPQDDAFVQGQLLRSIASALVIAGYDSVRPSALESFRAQAEEYMLHFLSTVRESMLAARRTSPIPQDFAIALALSNLDPSSLRPHLDLDFPADLASPHISPPASAEQPPRNLVPMLGKDLAETTQQTHPHIPSHFPPLPSRHTWQSTAVFTEREKDPRKIRERATQEGILAEQALRKLTSANKPRSMRQGKTASKADKMKEQLWQDTLAEILKDEGGTQDADANMRLDDAADGLGGERSKTADMLKVGGGMVVNHDRAHWRQGAPARAVRS